MPMRKLLLIFFTLFIWLTSYAQCDKANTEGLKLIISPVEQTNVHNQLNIELKNDTEEELSFCWYDLEKTWGIPLCFKISVWDEAGDSIITDFSLEKKFTKTTLENLPKRQELIKIEADNSFQKEIILYWDNMTQGTYKVQLSYENGETKLISNTTTVRIK